MKKIIKALLISLIVLFVLLIISVLVLAPPLPTGASAIIEEVINQDAPSLVRGDTGKVESKGIKIWYESILPSGKPKGTIVLIMGLAGNAIEWSPYFYQPLVDKGYQVIRYDNRGTGLSDPIADWSPNDPYNLEDMSADVIAIMDRLKVSHAHIVGISMGGMIAQSLAIHYPKRISTLTSIMSSAYADDPALPKVKKTLFMQLIALMLKYGIFSSEESRLKLTIAARNKLSSYNLSKERIKSLAEGALYTLHYHQGFNREVFRQHTYAISISGSRVEELKKVTVPTLIIHGKEDPLIPIAHGRKCAKIIPNADSLWIEKMGHDLPPESTPQIHSAILHLIEGEKKEFLLSNKD